MPIYITLMNLTDKGIENIKRAPQRIEEGIIKMQEKKGKMLGFYLTMGEYDYVAVFDAPSDEVAASFLLGLGATGFVRTSTLKAFPGEEAGYIIKDIPVL
ncbi:MAG: GYD domain-containing protein [Syntrophales bacterium]